VAAGAAGTGSDLTGAVGATGVLTELVAGTEGEAAGVTGAKGLADEVALTGALTGAGLAGAVTVGTGARAFGPLFSRATKPRYKPKLKTNKMTVKVVVILVRTLADSPPKTLSAAPPPRADPIPALALGRCMRMMSTTRMLTKNKKTTAA